MAGKYRLGKKAKWLLTQINNHAQVLMGDSKFEKWFLGWPRNAVKALAFLYFDVNSIVSARTINEKKFWIKELQREVAENLHFVRHITINEFFSIEAAEDEMNLAEGPLMRKELEPMLWISAVSLGKSIQKSPLRIKLCKYCLIYFWDGETKSAHKRICGKIACKKKWDVDRARKSRGKAPKDEDFVLQHQPIRNNPISRKPKNKTKDTVKTKRRIK